MLAFSKLSKDISVDMTAFGGFISYCSAKACLMYPWLPGASSNFRQWATPTLHKILHRSSAKSSAGERLTYSQLRISTNQVGFPQWSILSRNTFNYIANTILYPKYTSSQSPISSTDMNFYSQMPVYSQKRDSFLQPISLKNAKGAFL